MTPGDTALVPAGAGGAAAAPRLADAAAGAGVEDGEGTRRRMVEQEEEVLREGLRRMEMGERGTRDIAEEGKRRIRGEAVAAEGRALVTTAAAVAVLSLIQRLARLREIALMHQTAERVRIEEAHESGATRISDDEQATWGRMVQWGRKKECVIDKLALARKWVEAQCGQGPDTAEGLQPHSPNSRNAYAQHGGGAAAARYGGGNPHKASHELNDLQRRYLEVTKAGSKASQKLLATRRRPCSGRAGTPVAVGGGRPESSAGGLMPSVGSVKKPRAGRGASTLKIRGTHVQGPAESAEIAAGSPVDGHATPPLRPAAHVTTPPHTCPPLHTYMGSPGPGMYSSPDGGGSTHAQGAPHSWARRSPEGGPRTAVAGFSRRLTALQAQNGAAASSTAGPPPTHHGTSAMAGGFVPVMAKGLPCRPNTAASAATRPALGVQESITQKPVHFRASPSPVGFHTPAKPPAAGGKAAAAASSA